jgi:hypothetical protein
MRRYFELHQSYSSDKMYTMCQLLPKFVNDITSDTFVTFQAEELGNFEYGTATTRLTCANFPEIKTTVNKVLLRYISEGDPGVVGNPN